MKAKKPKKDKPPKKPRKRAQAERATPAIIEQRVQAILQVRLDGAEGWDVRQYVADQEAAGEQPWKVEAGCKPLSERQIREYVTKADELIATSCRITRREALRRHKAQRRSLYARAVQAGDIGNALAVLKDLAALQDLYPAKKVKAEHSGHVHIDPLADLTAAELDAERRRLEKLCPRSPDAGDPSGKK
jgi:hypothetical protein